MPRLATLPRPFIVGVVTDRTVADAAASIASALRDGAEAVELNLPAVGDIGSDAMASLVGIGPVVYTSCRRTGFMAVYGIDPSTCPAWSEDERMAVQVAALAAGSVAVDIELDTFDPNPAPTIGSPGAAAMAATRGEAFELTRDTSAEARQRDVVAQVKELGGEVLASCHTGRRQTADQLVAIVDVAVARGADLVKIVTPCVDDSDLEHIFEAHRRLAQTGVPFTVVGAGPVGGPSRRPGPGVRSAWYLGRPADSTQPYRGQPGVGTLCDLRDAATR